MRARWGVDCLIPCLHREHIKQDMLRLQATVGSQVGRGSSGVDNHTKAGGLLQEVHDIFKKRTPTLIMYLH